MSKLEKQPSTDSENHVKFNIEEEELRSHHESLEIVEIGHNKYDVNLGYLKMDHYYKVSINLKLTKVHKKFVYLENISSKYISFKEVHLNQQDAANGDNSSSSSSAFNNQIVIVFHVHREKLDKEVIYFMLDDTEKLELHIEAKVLGINQGTPLLRNGITLLHNHSSQHSKKISNENLHFNIN